MGFRPMFARLYRPPAASYFLFGPRGTGKSTWLRTRYADALWIDLNDPENTRFYGAAPERLRAAVAANPSRRPIVIDSYWRTRSGSEVDFVLYGESGLYALEVKNSATLHPGDLTGLRSFAQDYPEATPILLYRGRRVLERDILCLPCDAFLRALTPGRSFATVVDTA